MQAAPSIQKLLDELERLPGVGPKSAQRMAYWILNTDAAEALRLAVRSMGGMSRGSLTTQMTAPSRLELAQISHKSPSA